MNTRKGYTGSMKIDFERKVAFQFTLNGHFYSIFDATTGQ